MKKFIITFFAFLFITASGVLAEETLILLDSSLSMSDDFYGTPKYVAAVNEAKRILSELDSNKKIGLRTIGVKFNENILNFFKDPNLMCKATQLEVPIRQNNTSYLNSALDSIFPLGTTPLEFSLRTAINSDFSYGSHLKHIVLITDGAESCDADPCRFIREVMTGRKDIRIDILAISVNDEDFEALKCLSDNTNGTIINVKSTNELNNAYRSVLTTPVNIQTQSSFTTLQPQAVNRIKYKNILLETFD